MPFNWAGAIEKNRDDLIGIVTTLFVMAGIRAGRVAETLPRGLYWRILRLLRPAEFAARRLILVAASRIGVVVRANGRATRTTSTVIPGPETADAPPSPGSIRPVGEATPPETGTVVISPAIGGGRGTGPAPATAALRLSSVESEDGVPGEGSRPAPGFALFDPFKRYGYPWIEPGDEAASGFEIAPGLPPDEPVRAVGLCNRIRALEAALQHVHLHARRLARWRARRDRETCRPRRWSVMRPGLPPGWRRRPKTRIEELLWECHGLALDAWNSRGPPGAREGGRVRP